MPPPQGVWNPIEGPGDYSTTREVHNDTYPAIDPTKANLSGKAIFISGASRGLGKSIAISFAKAGAPSIAIGARSNLEVVAKEVKKAAIDAGRKEPHVLTIKLDVSDAKSVADAVRKVGNEFGKLDVVINNAGILGKRQPIADSDPDDWWETMNVNVKGPYLITRACLPLLKKSDLKTIINVASVGGVVVSPGISDYQTSKLTLIRLTEFTAKENEDVVAFVIHPGNMLTDIVGKGEGMDPALKAIFTETTELTADGLVYLAKEKRDWLSGRYVNMTWDLPELTSKEMEKKIVEGDLLKVKLVTPSFQYS